MKSLPRLLLVLSLLSNALLLALLVWKPRTDAALTAVPPVKSVEMTPKPAFDWQDINSPDFATYVANLRGIGCPKNTLQDIVSAEVERLYTSGSDTPPMDKASLVAALLSPPPAQDQPGETTAEAAAQPAAPAPAAAPSSPALAEMIPAAFIDGTDPRQLASSTDLFTKVSDASIDPQTAATIETIRNDFHDQVLPEANDAPAPGSKEYLKLWWQAKFRSDDFYSSMRGGDALNAAAGQAYQSLRPPAKQ